MINKTKIDNHVSPNDGGCWFCYKEDQTLVFDTEFDTFVHTDCIKKVLKKDPENIEAGFMKYLLNTEQENANSSYEYDYDESLPF